MNKQHNTHLRGFIKYMRRTMWNKIFAIGLICLGLIVARTTGEASLILLATIFGIPLFLTKENWTYID